MDTINIQYFISLIKKRPIIWNTDLEGYKNRQLKKEQWNEISAALFPDYENMAPSAQANLCKEVQGKWKNIRDSYIRSIRHHRSKKRTGRMKRPIKNYIYAPQLTFMKHFYNSHSAQDSSSTHDSDKQDEDQEDLSMSAVGSNYNNTHNGEEQQIIESDLNLQKTNGDDRLEQYIETCITEEQYQKPDDNYTGDMDFFKSLIPSICNLPLNEKIKFRIDVMKLALEYNERNTVLNSTAGNLNMFGTKHVLDQP